MRTQLSPRETGELVFLTALIPFLRALSADLPDFHARKAALNLEGRHVERLAELEAKRAAAADEDQTEPDEMPLAVNFSQQEPKQP